MSPAAVIIELLGLVAVGLLSVAIFRPGSRRPAYLGRSWSRLGRRHRAALGATALLSFGLSAAVSCARWPVPEVHDEFAYLLAADTFAHGRLTNPPHPLWVHFETFHVLQQPTYAAKYPPAQGLMMAAGRVLGGYEIVGVWLGTALAAAAMGWMLRAWMPGRWALWGGLVVVLHPCLQLRWGQCYWGGSVALLGGALVWGGWGRLRRRPTAWNVGAWTLGGLVLLNVRPFEGLVICAVTALTSVVAWLRNPLRPKPTQILPCLLPSFLLTVVTASWMAYYDFRVTGNPLRLPYQLHEETYMVSPVFLWQPVRQIEYRHPVLEEFYRGWAATSYFCQQDLPGWIKTKGAIAVALSLVFLRLVLAAPCVALPWVLRRAESRLLAWLLLICVGPSLTVVWWQPHYLAPVLPLIMLLVVQACRQACLARCFGRRLGPALAWGLGLVLAASLAAETALHVRARKSGWFQRRAEIARALRTSPGRDLVIVRYRPAHDTLAEWVYNAADIDGADVVWTRDMNPDENRRLVEYFHDRRVWLLDADADPPRLIEQQR